MDEYFKNSVAAKGMLVFVAIFLMCSNGLVGEYAWRVSECDTSFILLLAETFKLCISIHYYIKECKEQKLQSELSKTLSTQFWYDARLFGVPAFLYFLLNNANMIALKYLPSHLVQMLANFKLIMVAGLAVAYLKQKISKVQWGAIFFVCLGMGITMMNPGKKSESTKEGGGSVVLALVYGIVAAAVSSIAGIFCEKLYKTSGGNPAIDMVHIQNIKMYSFGMFFNFLSIMIYGLKHLDGFNFYHLIMTLLTGFGGISMGFIMKYLDNVIRGIAVALGSIASTVLSVALLGNELTGHFAVGGSIVLIAAHMYNSHRVPAPVTDEESGVAKIPEQQMPYMHLLLLAPFLLLVLTGSVSMLDAYFHATTSITVAPDK
jgi:drug/metabolite transporter (DMT)-like permease|eukprot:Stramenopile-MAST_4_protein_2875